MNLYTNNEVSEKLATSISGNSFLHYCENGCKQLVESSSAPPSEPTKHETHGVHREATPFWGDLFAN